MDPATLSVILGGMGVGSSLLGNWFNSGTAKDISNQAKGASREQSLLQMMLLNKQLKRIAPFYNIGLEGLAKYAQEAFTPQQSEFYRIMADDMTKRLSDQFTRYGLGNSSEYYRTFADTMRRLGAEERERQIGRLQNLMGIGYSAASGTPYTQISPYLTSIGTAGLEGILRGQGAQLSGRQDVWNSVGNLGLSLLGYGLK